MENSENQPEEAHIESIFPPKIKRGKINVKIGLSRKMKFLILFLGFIVVAYSSLLEYVEPNEFGIKVVKIGFHRGVQKKVYETGLHLVLPFGMQQMYKLPRDLQVLELTNYPESASEYAREQAAAHIQTSDGFFVDVDKIDGMK